MRRGQEGIQGISALKLLKRVVSPAGHKQEIFRIAGVCPSRAGIEFERTAELALRACPVPVESKRDITERGVGFREGVIQCNSPVGGGFGLRHHLEWSSIIRAQIG